MEVRPEQNSSDSATSLRLERVLIASSVLAAMVFVTVGIRRSLWLDEANGVLIASHTFTGIVEALRRDNYFPFYYFLLSVWMRIFGNSEIALRALSAAFYFGGCGAAYALGKHLALEARGAWYSMFFYACSRLTIVQAENIRMYSLLGMLSGLSVLGFLRLFWDKDSRWHAWAFFIAVNAIAILTHPWAAFLLVAQFLALLVLERREVPRFVLAGMLAGVPFLALWGRFFPEQARSKATAWMPTFRPRFFVWAAADFYGLVVALVLMVLLARGLFLTGAKGRSRLFAGKGVRMVAVIFGGTVLVPLLTSIIKPIYWPGRYLIIAVAPLAVLLGALLPSITPRPLLALLAMALLAVQIAAHIEERDLDQTSRLRLSVPGTGPPPGGTDRRTVLFLLQRASPGDAVVFTSLNRAAADYYIRRAHAEDRFVEVSFPTQVADHMGWIDATLLPEVLASEASTTTGKLREMVAHGRRVWFYDTGVSDLSSILKQMLDTALPNPREHALSGPYHRRILEYGGSADVVKKN